MAEDHSEILRPKKKVINPSEITGSVTPEELSDVSANQAKLEEMSQIRKMASEEINNPYQNPDAIDRPVFTGNIPKQLDAARRRAQQEGEAPPVLSNSPASYMAKDEVFNELLSGLTTNSYEEIILPSKGRFYNGMDGPTDGVLRIRQMTGKEEEILAQPRNLKKGNAMNMIFKNCIQKYSPEKLLTIDRTFLLIYLRGISYSPFYEVELNCADCDNRFKYTVDLDALQVTHCPDNFDETSLEDQFPDCGYLFKYRLSRGEDDDRVRDYREKRSREYDATNDDSLLFRIAILTDGIRKNASSEYVTDQNKKMHLLRSMGVADVNYIRNVISEPPFGVNTVIETECSGCLHEFKAELPLETSFFFPKARKTTTNQA